MRFFSFSLFRVAKQLGRLHCRRNSHYHDHHQWHLSFQVCDEALFNFTPKFLWSLSSGIFDGTISVDCSMLFEKGDSPAAFVLDRNYRSFCSIHNNHPSVKNKTQKDYIVSEEQSDIQIEKTKITTIPNNIPIWNDVDQYQERYWQRHEKSATLNEPSSFSAQPLSQILSPFMIFRLMMDTRSIIPRSVIGLLKNEPDILKLLLEEQHEKTRKLKSRIDLVDLLRQIKRGRDVDFKVKHEPKVLKENARSGSLLVAKNDAENDLNYGSHQNMLQDRSVKNAQINSELYYKRAAINWLSIEIHGLSQLQRDTLKLAFQESKYPVEMKTHDQKISNLQNPNQRGHIVEQKWSKSILYSSPSSDSLTPAFIEALFRPQQTFSIPHYHHNCDWRCARYSIHTLQNASEIEENCRFFPDLEYCTIHQGTSCCESTTDIASMDQVDVEPTKEENFWNKSSAPSSKYTGKENIGTNDNAEEEPKKKEDQRQDQHSSTSGGVSKSYEDQKNCFELIRIMEAHQYSMPPLDWRRDRSKVYVCPKCHLECPFECICPALVSLPKIRCDHPIWVYQHMNEYKRSANTAHLISLILGARIVISGFEEEEQEMIAAAATRPTIVLDVNSSLSFNEYFREIYSYHRLEFSHPHLVHFTKERQAKQHKTDKNENIVNADIDENADDVVRSGHDNTVSDDAKDQVRDTQEGKSDLMNLSNRRRQFTEASALENEIQRGRYDPINHELPIGIIIPSGTQREKSKLLKRIPDSIPRVNYLLQHHQDKGEIQVDDWQNPIRFQTNAYNMCTAQVGASVIRTVAREWVRVVQKASWEKHLVSRYLDQMSSKDDLLRSKLLVISDSWQNGEVRKDRASILLNEKEYLEYIKFINHDLKEQIDASERAYNALKKGVYLLNHVIMKRRT